MFSDNPISTRPAGCFRAVQKFCRYVVGMVAVLGVQGAASPASAELILNEALANEPGSATSAEWVEVINWPDTSRRSISLNGYRFVDGNDTTTFGEALVIPPDSFLVIARRVTGANSFESIWGDNSGVWGDAPSESYPVIAADMALRNSHDTVSLVSPDGFASTIFWRGSAGDGESTERIRPDHGDTPENFAVSRDSSGSTPGKQNSVFPARNDLTLDAFWISTVEPASGEPIRIMAQVTNVGFGTASKITVRLSRAIAFGLPDGEKEILFGWWIDSLVEGATDTLSYTWTSAIPGRHLLFARIESDGNPDNNSDRQLVLAVRHTQPLVIISEFLANPETVGPGEWVEVSNQSNITLDMAGVAIGDAQGQSNPIPGFAGSIPPRGFWILADEESSFLHHYPDFDGILVGLRNWPGLNNTGDQIRLLGVAGEVIDSTSYGDLYEDNRSVERITLTATHADPDDWTGSVDPSGATPGRANSVNREAAGRLMMSAQPNPLYLSSRATMEIAVRLEIGESLTLRVFDRAGNHIRTLVENQPAASGPVTWDGADEDGQPVKPGMYILWARSEPSGREFKMAAAIAP